MHYHTKFSGINYYIRNSGRRQTGQCPYNIAHRKTQGRGKLQGRLLFKKWVNRPNRAYALYWRMHPQEELAVNNYWKRK